jgi:hypothetical protein
VGYHAVVTVAGANGRQGWIRAVDLRPATGGRSNRCETVAELQQRLNSDGVVYVVDDLPQAMAQLERKVASSTAMHPSQLLLIGTTSDHLFIGYRVGCDGKTPGRAGHAPSGSAA